MTNSYQCNQDEEDHERATEHGFAVDVTVAHCWHGDERQVDAFPVRQMLSIVKAPRIAGVLDLPQQNSSFWNISTACLPAKYMYIMYMYIYMQGHTSNDYIRNSFGH